MGNVGRSVVALRQHAGIVSRQQDRPRGALDTGECGPFGGGGGGQRSAVEYIPSCCTSYSDVFQNVFNGSPPTVFSPTNSLSQRKSPAHGSSVRHDEESRAECILGAWLLQRMESDGKSRVGFLWRVVAVSTRWARGRFWLHQTVILFHTYLASSQRLNLYQPVVLKRRVRYGQVFIEEYKNRHDNDESFNSLGREPHHICLCFLVHNQEQGAAGLGESSGIRSGRFVLNW